MECGWPKSSILRIMQTLMSLGAVARDPDTLVFRALLRLTPINTEDQHLREHCAPAISELCKRTRQTIELHRFAPNDVEMIDRQEPEDANVCVRARVGWRHPLAEFDSIMQICFAFGSQDLSQLPSLWFWLGRDKSPLTRKTVEQTLTKVKKDQFATDLSININSVRRYASPIIDQGGRLRAVVAAAQACTVHDHEPDEKLGRQLHATAKSLGERLAAIKGAEPHG